MPPAAVKWSKITKKGVICSRVMWHGAVKKHKRPPFAETMSALIHSPNGKEWLKERMAVIKGTAVDVGFAEAIRNAGLGKRFEGLGRNRNGGVKAKKHPNAIDFQMGEQNDSAANELRGAVANGGTTWKPPDHLLLTKDWTISDERIFELIEAALRPDADQKAGPLAEANDRRKETSSTGKGKAATFVVDYLIALTSAVDSVA